MAYLLGSVIDLFLMFGVIDHVHSCALWNPATREVRLLHLPPPMINDRPVFGLGVDLLTNDYKVVCYLCENSAAVYSCSRDSWRIFKHRIPFFTGVKQTFGTAYSNGVYYWLLRGHHSYYTVLLFDFGSEMFEGIEGPHIHTYVFGLMLVDDSIAILSLNDLNMSDYAIWVMIQPGVWSKLVTFQCFPFIKSCYDSSLILATRTSRLISYNVRTNKLKDLAFQRSGLGNHAKASGCGVFYYNESLVTIKQRDDGELDH
ncbi:F-box/kelch-repeat protein At3g06240-like [Solanum tuberosum]|nr:PREDICTED: F-box/kelch-repeat protein At3g06240-like [Solanum tuberosum]